MNRLHPITRILQALAALTLVSAYFTPLWQIQLWAPQYPEGLNMKIWIDKLSGAFDIINGLNHYIGMALIREEMFPEFKFMIYLLGGLIGLGILAAVIGTRRALLIYIIVLALGALAGLGDFYRWGYQYGHNLDPHAAIQVPGMSYQPPLIGYKNLLNFTAYSGPDIGGVLMIASGCLSGLLLGWELFVRKGSGSSVNRSKMIPQPPIAAAIMLASVVTLTGCDAKPEPFRYGKDECESCRMVISDQRFGAEIVTHKGRVHKFDDIGCMADFVKDGSLAESEVKDRYVSNFNLPNTFIAVGQAHFLRGGVKSPMGSDAPAFATESELNAVKAKLQAGEPSIWPKVLED